MKQLLAAHPWKQASWRILIFILLALVLAGCAHMPDVFQMEPRSAAKQLGMPSCRVSVPMSESSIVEILRRWDNVENPQDNPEWVAITSNRKPEDQIRMFSCKAGSPYFYALVRNGKILFEYHPLIID